MYVIINFLNVNSNIRAKVISILQFWILNQMEFSALQVWKFNLFALFSQALLKKSWIRKEQ